MAADNTLYCSFCGKSQHEVRKLIAGPTVFICDECAELCFDIVREDRIVVPMRKETASSPTEIRSVLDDAIDGQDLVKGMLSVMLHLHFARMADGSERDSAVSPPANILLCGPSMGRSEVVRALTRCLPIPVATVDATRLIEIRTARDVSQSIIHCLLDAAAWHRGQAQRGILYVDDFDCLANPAAKPSGASMALGEKAQKALASLMRGTAVEIATGLRTKLSVDTGMITFICAGTFFGLSNQIARPSRRSARGRGTKDEGQDEFEGLFRLSDAQAEALVDFGFLPDLVSCLSGIVALESPKHSHE